MAAAAILKKIEKSPYLVLIQFFSYLRQFDFRFIPIALCYFESPELPLQWLAGRS